MTRTGIQDDIILTRVVFNLLKIMWLLFLLNCVIVSFLFDLSVHGCKKFKDLMIWDICQQTIAPPLDICHISPDPGGEICHSVFQNGKFPWVSPGSPLSVITMTSA